MTTTPVTSPDQPHVIVFAEAKTLSLVPCASNGDGLDKMFAIYGDRATAESQLPKWQAGMTRVTYFVVPAHILFDEVVSPRFVRKT